MKKLNIKPEIKRMIPLILVAAALLFWYLNIRLIAVNKTNLESDKIVGELKFVLISDLHGESFGIDNYRLINKIRHVNPDLIFAVGDMCEKDSASDRKTAVNLLASLAYEFDVYFVPGEHDRDTFFYNELSSVGVHVMNYKSERLTLNGSDLCIYGIDNSYYSATFDLSNEFELDDSVYNILLAHIPNQKAFASFGCDLTLCGDTHGGIVRLPFVGALTDGSRLFPELYGIPSKGLYEYEGGAMYITSGLGNYPVPFRMFNLPEIAVISLSSPK